jgi:hypothetical protein
MENLKENQDNSMSFFPGYYFPNNSTQFTCNPKKEKRKNQFPSHSKTDENWKFKCSWNRHSVIERNPSLSFHTHSCFTDLIEFILIYFFVHCFNKIRNTLLRGVQNNPFYGIPLLALYFHRKNRNIWDPINRFTKNPMTPHLYMNNPSLKQKTKKAACRWHWHPKKNI